MTITTERESRETPTDVSPGHTPGEIGIWVLIIGDMVLFALYFVHYLIARHDDTEIFDAAQQRLNQNYGAVNTMLLLVSSLAVVVAVHAVRKANMAIARPAIVAAFACGMGFSAIKIFEYSEKLNHGLTPMSNDFFLYFFLLTGLHWFHLIVGLGVLAYLFALTGQRQLSAQQIANFEGGACFWHMVDLLWIVLFPLLYLVK